MAAAPRTRSRGELSAVTTCLLLAGCVLSIDAVVPDSGATFDLRLLGSWEEVDGSDRATIARAAGNAYAIEYTDGDGKVGWFEARLGRLGARQVLDVWPAPRDGEVPSPYAEVFVAGHVLLAIDVGTDDVSVAPLQADSLLAALRAGRVRLGHGRSDDRVILHGTTEQLRAALAPYLSRPGALGAPGSWRRANR